MDKDLIKIGDIEKFSIVDFPNKIAAVVFMQGCPWRCPFCYNQSLQSTKGDSVANWENLINLLEHRIGILDAVVFSGGEPLMQTNLPFAMDKVIDLGFTVGLHTGGYNPEALKKVLSRVKWIGLDIKAPLINERYTIATGGIGQADKVKESLNILLDSGLEFECRTTCDPRILDIQDIYTIADQLSSLGVREYYIQKYRPIPSDTTTTYEECNKFFEDLNLKHYLLEKFEKFDTRE